MYSGTFTEAQTSCQSLGGTLPCITNDEQNIAIVSLSQAACSNSSTPEWIANFGPDQTCSSDYSNLKNNIQEANFCIQLSPGTSQWQISACTARNNFICAYPANTACESGWFIYKNSCFGVFSTSVSEDGFSWMQAQEYCSTRIRPSAYLTSIMTAEENNFIAALLQTTVPREQYVWIGAISVEGENFKWADGNSIEYKNWGLDQPTLDGKNPCGKFMNGIMLYYANFASWYSTNCSSSINSFICRYDL